MCVRINLDFSVFLNDRVVYLVINPINRLTAGFSYGFLSNRLTGPSEDVTFIAWVFRV